MRPARYIAKSLKETNGRPSLDRKERRERRDEKRKVVVVVNNAQRLGIHGLFVCDECRRCGAPTKLCYHVSNPSYASAQAPL